MRKNAFVFLALVGSGLVVVGCGDGDSSPCPEGEILCDGECIDACGVSEVECDCVCIAEIQPVLSDIQASVFDISCTASSCHGSQNPQAGLELSTAEISAENLIDVESEQVPGKNRVTPSAVEDSYISNKLTGIDMAPGTQQMPFGFDPLCNAKIIAVEAWIADGAPL